MDRSQNIYQINDRVKGIRSHRGKFGTVIDVSMHYAWIKIQWDGGKTEDVMTCSVTKIE